MNVSEDDGPDNSDTMPDDPGTPSSSGTDDGTTGFNCDRWDVDASNFDNGYSGAKIDSSEETLGSRATGGLDVRTLEERACTSADFGEFAKGLNESRDSAIGSLLKGLEDNLPNQSTDRRVEESCRIVEANPGERVSVWGSLDSLSNSSKAAVGYVSDFVNGSSDFLRNYNQMVDVKTIGADKYYHCLANCESAQRGPGGVLAATIISEAREGIDQYKNVYLKGIDEKASVADGLADMHANDIGRQGGVDGTRCYDVCRQFEPRWHK